MTTPTLSTVARHFDAHGGLWLVVPRQTDKGQPRPLFALLGVAQGPLGPFITYEGGDFRATIDDNAALQGAEWVPVDTRGTRV
jgi:hypothetical protein